MNNNIFGFSLISIILIHISYITLEFLGVCPAAGFLDYLVKSYLLPFYILIILLIICSLITLYKNKDK